MDNQKLFDAITNQIPGLVVVYNIVTGEYLYVNSAVKKILGWEPEDFTAGGMAFAMSLVHPGDLPRIMEQNSQALEIANANPQSLNQVFNFEYRMRHRDGTFRWLHTEGSVFSRGPQNKVEVILNISLDITERKEKEDQLENLKQVLEHRVSERTRELQESEHRFRSLVEAVEDYAIFRLDTQGRVTSWNEGIEYILGYSKEEILGQPISLFFPAKEQEQGLPQRELEQAKSEGTSVHEGVRVRKDGTTFYTIATTTAIWDQQGSLEGFSKIMRDITELKEAEETIRYQALHDTLTGLANRKALDDHYNMAESIALRNKNKLAILFLDLDRFKTINDTLGHGVGDMILKEVAHRLLACVRQLDTVARLGGDEFIILLNDINSAQDVAHIADKILQSFVPVMRIQDQSLHVSSSIGIAIYPADGQDIYTLLKNADTALYRAKDAGRNRYQFYNYSMNLQSVVRLSLEQDLRNAVSQGQLRMVYQPFISLKTNQVVGVEALIRWHHPKLGVLHPYDFIPMAEETGMIASIGKWVLQTVCHENKRLKDKGLNLHVTVNLSARQFAEAELVDTIEQALAEADLPATCLELEITESVAMENIARTSSKLNDLKQKGLTIAIDDFGTGYSSLSYLKRFPVHKLKIDKSFVKHAITDQQDSTIIRAIISMGHSLGLKVCAEGVESQQQLALLESLGCDLAQGYLISKPLPPAELELWLNQVPREGVSLAA
jgi:diguanylate cyclase